MLNHQDTFETVYESSNLMEWNRLRDFLQHRGIEVLSLGGNITAAQIGLGDQSLSHRIQVPVQQAERASQIVRTFLTDFSEVPEAEELEKLALQYEMKEVVKRQPRILNNHHHEIKSMEPFSTAFYGSLLFTILRFVQWQAPSSGGRGHHMEQLIVLLIKSAFFSFLTGFLLVLLYNMLAKVKGIQFVSLSSDSLFSLQYKEKECFFQNENHEVKGPLSIEAVTSLVQQGKILPHSTVQVGSLLVQASEIHFML